MLHNFGGNLGMYGTVENVTRGPVEALNDSKATIVGTGLTPEGIEQNDVVYELMNEMGWRTQPVNLASWVVGYARRRYGGDNTLVSIAWSLLFQSIYNSTISRQNHCHAIPVVRPALDLNPPPRVSSMGPDGEGSTEICWYRNVQVCYYSHIA
ncbi:alpha-N-acetylglucosaminidase-like isoform X2 [Corticium candelabrum]|uniref:alpha-N-acetylglucosaminidase-like isoform X2 n=1 Tax=Corticium candelabrum TaxID=121492 RepID=UPI002E2556B0|nr:alpha-N-acetylglucosaminidase-like isoform X2 [Corticium candelabrum]